MKNWFLLARIGLVGVIMLGMVSSASARSKGDGYQTGFVRWRAADQAGESNFSNWILGDGVKLNASGALEFDTSANLQSTSDPYPAGGYYTGNYYNAGTFYVGEAISPAIPASFNFAEAIASWNASTPLGSWVEVQFRVQFGSRWSKWYVLGIWASDYSTIHRHSVRLQGDSDGYVAVDTFVSSNKKETTNAFQLKVLLFSEDKVSTPSVRNISLAYSTTPPKKASVSTFASTAKTLNVPECSQMVYPDGGEVWCSPTSTSMVLGYWNTDPGSTCADREPLTVEGVYDWIYDGHGNWPFNTAYAATKSVTENGVTKNLEGYVARFTSLNQAEKFIAADVPVIMSIAWGNGDLTGSSVGSTNGHLLVLVGFDENGNPIVNDPAFPEDGAVQVTYQRAEFEPLWLQASGGTVYLIYPEGWAVPPIE
jgi:hypothetical protein